MSKVTWMVLVLFALAIGGGAGIFVGLRYNEARSDRQAESGDRGRQAQGDRDGEGEDLAATEEVEALVAEARAAVGEGEWYRARQLFEKVRGLDPGNAVARTSLPLIDRRLSETKATVVVSTVPPGADVTLEGFGSRESPAEFAEVPLGRHRVEIAKEGYETVFRELEITGEGEIPVPEVKLEPSAGRLEVVSEPVGAAYKLLRKNEGELEELVQVGKTPAMFEKLDPGEYQVLMEVDGWPEYSQMIKVQHNRDSSVSAVFAKGGLNLTSDPAGAEVWLAPREGNATKMGETPCILSDLPVGRHRIELRHRDWKPITRTVEVAEGVTQSMEFAWERALVSFVSDPPGAEVRLEGKRLGNGVEVTPFDVELPEAEYLFTARRPGLDPVTAALEVDGGESRAVEFSFDYGSVHLDSEPPGAAVVSAGSPLGRTPLTIPYVKPGSYSYTLSKENHRDSVVSGQLEAGGTLRFESKLKYEPAPPTTRDFENGFKQKMVWIGELNGWVAATETKQRDYERVMGENPSYFEAPDRPVDTVTWYEAAQYCERFTLQEGGLGNLPQGYRYRLPTDEEWSVFVGDAGLDQAVTSLYEQQKSTAPVASLVPNQYGLHDVRGNVMEWCQDWYSQSVVARVRREGASVNEAWIGTERKVLRGGSWARSSQYDLSVANRVAARPSAEDRYDIGFRVVLMPE